MLHFLYPYACAGSVFSIDYRKLYRMGFRGILFDIDNTLVHHGDDSTAEVDDLFRFLHHIGLKTLLLTNNSEERVKRFIKHIDTLYLCGADKPKPGGYRKAMALMELEPKEVLCIGDQIFTDILGANRSGLASILVPFIRLDHETKLGKRRQLERIILYFYRHSPSYYNRLGEIEVSHSNSQKSQ
ncbi:MAG: YqeG family HAD IIIA-type phosphatase [Oscillospiraceae bacterium]|nr:YqeG family HAD IIIA-type phosphatase [Oscillospiraceae bacterium]